MTKVLLSTGGTGGHIFPILSLYLKLKEINEIEDVKIITDPRVKKFINIADIETESDWKIIKSDSPFRKKGIIHLVKTFSCIFFSTLKCLYFIISFKPKTIIGSGGYASVPVLLASLILRKSFILHETNAVLGRVNRLFLPFSKKLLSGYKDLKNFPKKYDNKFFHVGQLVRDEFLEVSRNKIKSKNNDRYENKPLKILILGGSQGAKVFGEKLPKCFKYLNQNKIKLSIKQQVHKEQLDNINEFYKNNTQFDVSLFEFKKNIQHYIAECNIVICRSGSSTLAELSILNKPFIAIPLPTSLDNHQYFNAKYYYDNNCCWLLEENSEDFEEKMVNILMNIYNSDALLSSKVKNLIELDKKNAIDNFLTHILHNNGLTNK